MCDTSSEAFLWIIALLELLFLKLMIVNRSKVENEIVIFAFPSGKKLVDERPLSGTGRLTLAQVDTMQNVYKRAIGDNKNDAKVMSRAPHAILKYYSSTHEKP